MKGFVKMGAGVAFFAIVALLLAAPQAQAISKQEAKCSSGLGKGSAKLSKIYGKTLGKCLDADISGKTIGACPDSKGQSKIDKIAQKLIDKADGDCGSVCSVSNNVPCITNSTCPPLPLLGANGAQEFCTAGAALIEFNAEALGFPGPFCEPVLGKSL
jgi:hypothetical protein